LLVIGVQLHLVEPAKAFSRAGDLHLGGSNGHAEAGRNVGLRHTLLFPQEQAGALVRHESSQYRADSFALAQIPERRCSRLTPKGDERKPAQQAPSAPPICGRAIRDPDQPVSWIFDGLSLANDGKSLQERVVRQVFRLLRVPAKVEEKGKDGLVMRAIERIERPCGVGARGSWLTARGYRTRRVSAAGPVG
jgi:hypothetical protein